MNGFNKFMTMAFLSAAMLFTGVAQAIPIPQFDGLTKSGPQGIQAASEYVADLVQTAEKSLVAVGRPDDAARISKLFTTNAPNSNISIGMSQFYMTLALARAHDAKSNDEPSDVADVLAIALEQNDHIKLPDNFFTLADNLKPGVPSEKKK